jgi:hypothetical protein
MLAISALVPWLFLPRVSHAQPTPPTEPTVVLHVDAPEEVRLERRAPGDDAWTTMCASPCDQPVPTSGTYRVNGASVRASRPFLVTGPRGERIALTVHPASRSGHTTGVVALVGGSTVAASSLGLGVLDWWFSSWFGSGASGCSFVGSSQQCNTQNLTPFVITAGVAGAVAVVGLLVMLSNGSTEVGGPNIEPVERPAAPGPRVAPEGERPAYAPSTGAWVPILQGTF